MQRFAEYYQKMVDENSAIFKKFFEVHDRYAMNPQINQDEFNAVGREVVEIIREYERKLCSNSERGMYGKFSAKLSERFWAEVRKDYPKIDFVGVKIT
jgi:hypothetical protein